MDFNYQRWAKRLNFSTDRKRKTDLRNFPIEKVRLQPVMLLLPIGAAAYLPFGWVLQQRVSLAVPLVLEFIIAFCFIACNNTMSSLLVDLFPEAPSTAMAASNLVRCLGAGASAAAISPMLNGMGWGWCFTFLALLSLLNILLLWLEWLWGMGWREGRQLKAERKRSGEKGKGISGIDTGSS
jgi:MFS family permease